MTSTRPARATAIWRARTANTAGNGSVFRSKQITKLRASAPVVVSMKIITTVHAVAIASKRPSAPTARATRQTTTWNRI